MFRNKKTLKGKRPTRGSRQQSHPSSSVQETAARDAEESESKLESEDEDDTPSFVPTTTIVPFRGASASSSISGSSPGPLAPRNNSTGVSPTQHGSWGATLSAQYNTHYMTSYGSTGNSASGPMSNLPSQSVGTSSAASAKFYPAMYPPSHASSPTSGGMYGGKSAGQVIGPPNTSSANVNPMMYNPGHASSSKSAVSNVGSEMSGARYGGQSNIHPIPGASKNLCQAPQLLRQAPQQPKHQRVLPAELDFLFHFQDIRDRPSTRTRDDRFESLPSKSRSDILPGVTADIPDRVYRWSSGTVRGRIPPAHCRQLGLSTRSNCPHLFKCATVFVAGNGAFVSVPFDARLHDVATKDPWRWLEVSFDHVLADSASNHNYSHLTSPGDHGTLVQAGALWGPELFPNHCIPNRYTVSEQGAAHAGLTGELPLIIAAAVFSRGRLVDAGQEAGLLQSFQPQGWERHRQPDGREPGRGMVVTVWTHGNTSRAQLINLEGGEFGPFIRP